MRPEKYQNKYRRTSIRLQCWDYSNPGYYFITFCTKNRQLSLGQIINGKVELSPFGLIVDKCWQELTKYYRDCRFDAFIIMPDHIHGIIQIKHRAEVAVIHELPPESINVAAIHELLPRQELAIGQKPKPLAPPIHELARQEKFRLYKRKMLLAKIIGRFKMQSTKLINLSGNTAGHKFWQSRFYDHIIRDDESLYNIRQYIKNNPINWQNKINIP